jgi:two-component system sensor histidine kinase PilS (NtrC family)
VLNTPSKKATPSDGTHLVSRADVLRWLYVGRLTLVTGILAGALFTWAEARPQDTLVATVMFLVAVAFTSASFWDTHMRRRDPGESFLYAQVLLDILLVTGVVHVTGGPDSSFAPLYILVISAGALLLPLKGGVLMGGLASAVYFADLALAYQGGLDLGVGLRIGLFTLVAVLTGLVGDRLRRAGIALGAVESALQQLRLDTGDILANLSTGVLTVDGAGRLAYANPAAEALLGFDADRWLGRGVMDEVERLAPGMGHVLWRAIDEGRSLDRYQTASNRDGEDLTLGLSIAVLERGEGVPPSATAIFQDITDHELLASLNRRNERLEAIAALSASMAHEIKNPLASIRSAVEQLTRGSTLESEDRDVLQRLVLTESDRLSQLLSEFIDYSGLRIGAVTSVDLPSVVRDCMTLVRQHPDADGVEFVYTGRDTTLPVTGDPDLLHRAFFNLLLNASQFAGSGGAVTVSAEDTDGRASPRTGGMGRAVRLTVSDSGPGIDSVDLERIFDPFFTTRAEGSGLGLAVVHRAVDAHAGAIFVDRAAEGGAQFTIYLPAVDAHDGGRPS